MEGRTGSFYIKKETTQLRSCNDRGNGLECTEAIILGMSQNYRVQFDL
jgi:hypothetical protein